MVEKDSCSLNRYCNGESFRTWYSRPRRWSHPVSTVIATVGPFGLGLSNLKGRAIRSQPLLQRSVFAALRRDKWVLSDSCSTSTKRKSWSLNRYCNGGSFRTINALEDLRIERSQPLLQRWVLSDSIHIIYMINKNLQAGFEVSDFLPEQKGPEPCAFDCHPKAQSGILQGIFPFCPAE